MEAEIIRVFKRRLKLSSLSLLKLLMLVELNRELSSNIVKLTRTISGLSLLKSGTRLINNVYFQTKYLWS